MSIPNLEYVFSETKSIYGYEIMNKKGLNRLNDKDDEIIVFDVGANIGLVSYSYYHEYKKSKIYSFEPMDETHGHLEKNIKEYGMEDRIQSFHYGLSNKNEDDVRFSFNPTGSTVASYVNVDHDGNVDHGMKFARNYFWEKGLYILYYSTALPIFKQIYHYHLNGLVGKDKFVNANVRTISYFFEKLGINKVDILKIDAEGAEVDILNGIEKKDFEKIENFIIEVHSIINENGEVESLKPQIIELLNDYYNLDWVDMSSDGNYIPERYMYMVYASKKQ